MSTPSKTPETDAAACAAHQWYQALYPSVPGKNKPVHAEDMARLEQERDAAREENSHLRMENSAVWQARNDTDAEVFQLRERLDAARESLRVCREALEGWGMLYNTPPIVVGEEWTRAFEHILSQTIAALAATKETK